MTANRKLIYCGAPLSPAYLCQPLSSGPPSTLSGPIIAPLVFGIIVIHPHYDYSLLQDFIIEKNDYIASCCDCPNIGKQNYSHSTPPGLILAPLAFGVIVIHTHVNKSSPHHSLNLITFLGAAYDVYLAIHYIHILPVVRTLIVWC